MASHGLTRRGFRLLGILLLSSIGVLIYIHGHDIFSRFLGPRLPPLYQKVRESEASLPHYKEYKRKTVKYFLAANHFHSKKLRDAMIYGRPAQSPFFTRFGMGERHARLCHDEFARTYHQPIVSTHFRSLCGHLISSWHDKVSCLMTTFGIRTAPFTQTTTARKFLRALLSLLSWAVSVAPDFAS